MFRCLFRPYCKKIAALVAGAVALPLLSTAGISTLLFAGSLTASFDAQAITINDPASWRERRGRVYLDVSGGDAGRRNTVRVYDGDTDNYIDRDRRSSNNGDWSISERFNNASDLPCSVYATVQRGEHNTETSATVAVRNSNGELPPGCTPPPVNNPPTCSIASPAGNSVTVQVGNAVSYAATSNDTDGDTVTLSWTFNGGDPASGSGPNPGNATYNTTTGSPFTTVLNGSDGNGGNCSDSVTVTVTNAPPPPPPVADISINSTSQNGVPGDPVGEEPFAGDPNYVLLSINDLGMHCGDFDTRISSILPPFNVTHTQVIQKGSEPTILTSGINVVYSASSNPNDPVITTGLNAAGEPVLSSMNSAGNVFKTNFWDVAFPAYDPFYPAGILDLFYSNATPANNLDIGLPMPNVERFYLGDGRLGATQQLMPGILNPYTANDPKAAEIITLDQPFFTSFAFGYVATEKNWFEAAGIPLTAFDDFGAENPWQLMRVQAKSGGATLASLDTVLPISGEANCKACHAAVADGGNGAATQALLDAGIPVEVSIDDPLFDVGDAGDVPLEVSLEYAADINILRLHDLEHGSGLGANAKYTPDLMDQTPVVCQRCHYTPALDLAQLGPLGPENDMTNVAITLDDGSQNGVPFTVASMANGRDQVKHKSMSNVMHSHHATVTDTAGNALFPDMPGPIGRDPVAARDILNQTCYQCHPGRRVDCLRGAMANGGMLCQDCHGDMAQVGNDFTRNVDLNNDGSQFELGSDFYTNAATPRVPWANEPGCGSCHTGDVNDNMNGDANTVGAPDGIRLMQAYLSNDTKATPIVPTNKRFAENVVTADPNPNDTFDPTGNPMLYRVSSGHGGVMCEGCHGATHAIWPNADPDANDNVASNQLQGHSGVIVECSTCHGTAMNNSNTIDGPHGMHPVGDNTSFARGGHEHVDRSGCSDCHGPGGRGSNVGTVLSAAKADRNLRGTLVSAGEPVGCSVCH